MTAGRLRVHKLFLLAACLFILVFYFLNPFSSGYEIASSLFFITFLGLPHGALDFEIAKEYRLIHNFAKKAVFVSAYLAISAACVYFWFLYPAIALVLFLTVSVIHFSEDWHHTGSKIEALSISTMLLCLPAIVHKEEVQEYFSLLMIKPAETTVIIFGMAFCFFLALLLFFITSINKEFKNKTAFVEVSALTLMACLLPALLYFIVYFCFLHSLNHMETLSQNLKKSQKELWIKCIPMVLTTTAITAIVAYHWQEPELKQAAIQWIFIGLFALTIPHMVLIDILLKRVNFPEP